MAHCSVHSLSGSTGTYGFLELRQLARSTEKLLKDSLDDESPLPPEKHLHLRDLLGRLGALAAGAAGRRATTGT